MLNPSFEVVSREVTTEDPFDDQDQVAMDEKAQTLIHQLQLDNPCSDDDVDSLDHDLTVCTDLSDKQWEENFHTELSSVGEDDGEPESEEESTDLPCPKLRNLPQAIQCLEDVRQFLECGGYTQESTEIMCLISSLTKVHSLNLTKSSRQSEFFLSTL